MHDEDKGRAGAFGFSGTWREYAPIAFTNLLLTIVTLGIYTFWARARTRRYLWSRTRFIDDTLEWTGTGLELFVGYVLAILFFFVPLGAMQFVLQGALMRGHPGVAVLIVVVLYLLLLYLVGVAIFRALRYRLSRTWWHGIRGGSDETGFGYGWTHFWRTLVGYAAIGLLIPWSMATLWNRRLSAMSFGSLRFSADAEWSRVMPRFILFYLSPVIVVIGGLVVFGTLYGLAYLGGVRPDAGSAGLVLAFAALFYVFFFGVLGVFALFFYSAYYREVAGATRLGPLAFAFTARTRAWIKLVLGNIGLAVVTLGIGAIFIPYRNWTFFVRHLEAYGQVDLDDFTQSTTREPGQGEGLLDAFDVGAF